METVLYECLLVEHPTVWVISKVHLMYSTCHCLFQLGLPLGTIKACVLIENVLASFEAEQILYELRQHSAGLNCGIWDYSASFVNKFGKKILFKREKVQ